MKILIADDDRVSRIILESTLVDWGYEVIVVTNGLDACKVLSEAGAPALGILDWEMPGMTGPDVCKRIRASQVQPSPFLLLLTGNGDREHVARALSAGADDYLTKPFDPDELRTRLDAGLRVAASRSLVRAPAALQERSAVTPDRPESNALSSAPYPPW